MKNLIGSKTIDTCVKDAEKALGRKITVRERDELEMLILADDFYDSAKSFAKNTLPAFFNTVSPYISEAFPILR